MEKHIILNDDERCQEVYKYIKNNVLSTTYGGQEEQWGDFLHSLRDKTTHQELIKPNFTPKENARGYIIDWPNIKGENFAEIAQWEFGNNAFEMLMELFPILYGMDWIPGPYIPGMYANKSSGVV
jgi:hypothetical protein